MRAYALIAINQTVYRRKFLTAKVLLMVSILTLQVQLDEVQTPINLVSYERHYGKMPRQQQIEASLPVSRSTKHM